MPSSTGYIDKNQVSEPTRKIAVVKERQLQKGDLAMHDHSL